MNTSHGARREPAFSGVFSGTFLSIVLGVLLVVQGARLMPRGWLARESEPRTVAAPAELAPEEQRTVALFEAAAPSVVSVQTSNLRLFRDAQPTEVEEGSGSGFLWDEHGHVVTNYHVVRTGTRFLVRFKNGTPRRAEFVGAAPDYDLAVLRLDPEGLELSPLPLGRSSELRVGQRSSAIGYPFGLDQTLTTGVISGLDRMIQSQGNIAIHGVIQTDAAINPGNSGGPLLDSSGRLIGVNTAIAPGTGANTGVGFAVPVDTVNRIVPRILDEGSFDRAILGVRLAMDVYAADEGLQGAVIGWVSPGGPAARAGLVGLSDERDGDVTLGDVIVGIDRMEVRREADVYQALETFRAGDDVRVRVSRPSPKGRRVEELRVRLDAPR